MNSRETLLRTLAHEDGPLAVDFGSTGVTGMHVSCVAALREHYGLERHPVKVWEPFQMLGELEDDLLEVLGSDVTGISGRTTLFGFANEGWREWRCPWGQEVLVPDGFRPRASARGDLQLFPDGDTTVPPSGMMPAGGYFFDALPRGEAPDEDQLDPADNCEEFQLLGEADWSHWEGELARVRGSGRAVHASFGGTGFGDIALVPGPFLKQPRGIRQVADWYMALVEEPDYIHAVFERQCEVALANLARFAALAGEVVDVLFICGTDFGTQESQFCSPATFDALWLPYYRRVNDWVHAHTRWKTFKHTCGSITPLLPNLLEAGFDILNPVQCSARGMDPRRLKAEFGERIVFWGGGVDTQKTLPFGTPEAVRREVLERCEVFAPGGGFVFNTIHNLQALTPLANIVAMLDALAEYRGR
jgi:hypothetical protein